MNSVDRHGEPFEEHDPHKVWTEAQRCTSLSPYGWMGREGTTARCRLPEGHPGSHLAPTDAFSWENVREPLA